MLRKRLVVAAILVPMLLSTGCKHPSGDSEPQSKAEAPSAGGASAPERSTAGGPDAGGDTTSDRDTDADGDTDTEGDATVAAGCEDRDVRQLTEKIVLLNPNLRDRFPKNPFETLSCRQLAERLVTSAPVREFVAKDCKKTEACEEKGRCVPNLDDPGARRLLTRVLVERGEDIRSFALSADEDDEAPTCTATSDHCRSWEGCRNGAKCTLEDGACVVGGESDCAGSRKCNKKGLCGFEEGKGCIAETDAHCRESENCSAYGHCAVGDDGRCRAASAKHCKKSRICDEEGRCALGSSGSCVSKKAAHCKESEACRKHGKCTRDDSACVVGSDADCRQSTDCAEKGLCTKNGTYTQKCEAVFDRDCEESKACKNEGKCKALMGKCVDSERAKAECRNEDRCEEYGIDCHLIDSLCTNPPDFDCSETAACDELGLCDSVVTRTCSPDGTCGQKRVDCRATDPAHCKESTGCKKRGTCSVTDEKGFIECGRDWLCRDYKSTRKGVCGLSAEGCRQSERCRQKGECSLVYEDLPHHGRRPTCAPTEEKHCEQSLECENQGKCSLEPHPNVSGQKYCTSAN